jgi:hypothetical protein
LRSRNTILAGLIVGAAAMLAPAGATAKVSPKRVFFQEPAMTSEAEFFAAGGLELSASCGAGTDLTVIARTSVDNAMVRANRQGPGTDVTYAEFDNFDIAGPFDLFAQLGGDDTEVGGQLIYSRPDGRHITVDWLANEDSLAAEDQCLFAGVAEVAKPGRDRGSRKRIDFRADVGDDPKRVLNAGGLRLTASCEAGSVPELRARTTVDHSMLHVNSQSGLAGTYIENDDFVRGDIFALLGGLGTFDSALGQIVFATPGGAVVSVDWLSEQEDAYDGAVDCAIAGTARVAGKRSPARAFYRRAEGDDNPLDRANFRKFFKLGFLSLNGSCATDATQEITDSHPLGFTYGGPAQSSSTNVHLSAEGSAQGGATYTAINDDANGHGLTASASGAVAEVDWLAEGGGDAFGGGPDCLFAGTAELLKP